MPPLDDAAPWLPANALSQCSPEPALLKMLLAWGKRWLSESEPMLRAAAQDLKDPPQAPVRRRSNGGVHLAWRESMQWPLASAMLGHTIVPATLRPTDRLLLERTVEAAFDDCLDHLAGAFGSPRGQETGGPRSDQQPICWWEVVLGPQQAIARLGLAPQTLARLIKSELAPNVPGKLAPIRQALAAQPVTLSAALGQTSLTLAELRSLGAGDVLVLGSEADALLPIFIDGRPSPLRARLEAGEAGGVLTSFTKEQSHARS